ncbi:sensor histidine kinase [Bacillus sp. AK128]
MVLSSVTLNGLYHEIRNLVGPYKFMDLQRTYGPFLYLLLNIGFFILYSFLYYQREQGILYRRAVESLLEDIVIIADGNFHHKLMAPTQADLSAIAKNVNLIVDKLQNAMEEERLAEQAKKDLITNVSHDLRTPLTSMIGYLGLIEHDRYKDETELKYYVQIAYEKTKRLHQLINDLFEYTRVQNGGLKLKKNPINIAEILTQLSVQFRIQLSSAQMECRLYIPENQILVFADGDQLASVFENLISNAIKYGADGRYVDLYVTETNHHVQIEVVNYGSTISSLDLPFIFERFYRAEKSRSDSDKSSGLGLAIAKGIIELHEGTIQVQSDVERTVFTVTLPKIS